MTFEELLRLSSDRVSPDRFDGEGRGDFREEVFYGETWGAVRSRTVSQTIGPLHNGDGPWYMTVTFPMLRTWALTHNVDLETVHVSLIEHSTYLEQRITGRVAT